MALSVDNIIKLPTFHKLGIVFLIAALIVGTYMYTFHFPQLRRLEAKESKLNDLIRERNMKRRMAQDLDKFKDDLGRLNVDLKAALTKLPDKKEIPSLLRNISNLGREDGLEVLLFRPQPEKPGQFYVRVPVELNFVGLYHKIGMFFYHVGTLSRIVNIETFTMEKAPKGKKGEMLLNTSCIATTYTYLEKAAEATQKGKKK